MRGKSCCRHSAGERHGTFPIQDDYNLGTNWNLYSKWLKVRHFLSEANVRNYDTFYMNHLSASGGSYPYFIARSFRSEHRWTAAVDRAHDACVSIGPAGLSAAWDARAVVVTSGVTSGVCTIAFLGTNILTYDRLLPANYARVGMLMADFPGPGLINRTIALNAPYRK